MKRYFLPIIGFLLWWSSTISTYSQQCNVIYVAPGGAVSGASGTRDNPAEINYAVTSLMNSSIRKIFLAVGDYVLQNTFPLNDSMVFEGGFDPTLNWAKTNVRATRILRDTSNLAVNPNRIVAISAANRAAIRIQDVEIYVQDATPMGRGISVYGVYLNGCSNYTFNRCKIIAGNGANGRSGVVGINGSSGTDGQNGQNGSEDNSGNNLGGTGGNGWSSGSNSGGNGGKGGDKGSCNCSCIFSLCTRICTNDGNAGANGNGNGSPSCPSGNGCGGIKGVGNNEPLVSLGCSNQGNEGYNGRDGKGGTNGTNGPNGSNGVTSHSGGFFQNGDGVNGSAGTHGGGGGGGGGGGSQGGMLCVGNTGGSGAGGGGGGEGGQGGEGGEGGQGGGASFAVYTTNNGANGLFRDCKLQAGQPGFGGSGGPGGRGGKGGFGGLGGPINVPDSPCDIGSGGSGSPGGKGGNGGNGGDGSIGITDTLYIAGQAITVQRLKKDHEPVIYLESGGCTGTKINAKVRTTGSVVWFFGIGASPASANGDSVFVEYSTTGRKTITVVVNGESFTYNEFLDIRLAGSPDPVINSNDSAICQGQTPSFVSNMSANVYYWDFGGAASAVSGANLQTVNNIPFMNPGSYVVTLKLNTDCCGYSDVDSFLVKVKPTPVPGVSIEAVNQVITACSGDVLQFAATASNAGTSPTYSWRVNGISVTGASGPLFITNNLADGDTVTCAINSTLNCTGGQMAFSNPIAVTILSRPGITPGSITVPAFTTPNTVIPISASAAGGTPPYTFFWDFGNGSGGTGQNTSTLFSTPGTYRVKLRIRDANGCESVADSVSIQVQFSTIADFKPSVIAGCEPLTVTFDNHSLYAISYLWDFGDGSLPSTDASPTHTFRFTNSGIYQIRLVSISGVNQDTITQQIVVYPKPTADFRVTPSILWHVEDTAFFANTSLGARQWLWSFGDTASTSNSATDPNPYHVYENMGTYTVSLIVSNEFGCSDTIVKESIVRQTLDRDEWLNSNGLVVSSIYPNPFSSFFEIKISSEKTLPVKMELADITGKKIATVFSEKIQPGNQVIHYNIPKSLPDGLYLLLIQTDSQQYSAKLMHIQR